MAPIAILISAFNPDSLRSLALALLFLQFTPLGTAAAETRCRATTFESASYSVCKVALPAQGLRLFLNGADGNPFGNFEALSGELGSNGKKLKFAMNAGMYHEDRSPVGLYIEDGKRHSRLSLTDGYGNFHLKPNGVFYFDDKTAGILESSAFRKRGLKPAFATQSGPMLVINGKLHSRFLKNGTSRKFRNGVGISKDLKLLWFVISDDPVNFHSFARFFRDHLGAHNALYFDGTVSQLYAPGLSRHDRGIRLGPIVGIVE